MREELPGAVGHRPGHLRLVAQPRPTPLGAGPGLAFRTGPAVQRVRASGQPLDPLLQGPQLQPGLHLGLPGVGAVGREPVPPGAVRLLVHRHLLGGREPLGALLHLGQRLLQGVLGPVRRGGAAFGLARGALGLPGEPPELLGDPGPGLFRGAPPLGELLDQGRRVLAVVLGCRPGLGEFRAPYAQPVQLGRGLVDGGLHLDQAGRPGGTTVREVGAEHVAVEGHGHRVGPLRDQRLGRVQGRDHDVVPQHPLHGPPHLRVPADQLGGRYGSTRGPAGPRDRRGGRGLGLGLGLGGHTHARHRPRGGRGEISVPGGGRVGERSPGDRSPGDRLLCPVRGSGRGLAGEGLAPPGRSAGWRGPRPPHGGDGSPRPPLPGRPPPARPRPSPVRRPRRPRTRGSPTAAAPPVPAARPAAPAPRAVRPYRPCGAAPVPARRAAPRRPPGSAPPRTAPPGRRTAPPPPAPAGPARSRGPCRPTGRRGRRPPPPGPRTPPARRWPGTGPRPAPRRAGRSRPAPPPRGSGPRRAARSAGPVPRAGRRWPVRRPGAGVPRRPAPAPAPPGARQCPPAPVRQPPEPPSVPPPARGSARPPVPSPRDRGRAAPPRAEPRHS